MNAFLNQIKLHTLKLISKIINIKQNNNNSGKNIMGHVKIIILFFQLYVKNKQRLAFFADSI